MLIEALASSPGTVLNRKLTDDEWTRAEHLAALAVDQLAAANWQRAGKKGKPKPKPISPITRKRFEVGPETSGDVDGIDQDEVLARLHGYRTGAFDRG